MSVASKNLTLTVAKATRAASILTGLLSDMEDDILMPEKDIVRSIEAALSNLPEIEERESEDE